MNATSRPDIKLGYYKHFKGTVYRVYGVARDCEKEDNWLVIYGNAHGDWVRSYEDFIGQVDDQGKTVPRFEFIEEAIR